VAEKRRQQKIELSAVAHLDHLRIAESDGLAFTVGSSETSDVGRERNAQTSAVNRLSQPRVRLDPRHDPVLREAQLRVIGINPTGRLGTPLDEIAPSGR